MLEAVGHPVRRLHRSGYAGLSADDLERGSVARADRATSWRSSARRRSRETGGASLCTGSPASRAGCAWPWEVLIQKGYVSNVSAVTPNVLGLFANVLGGDDKLRLSNYSGKTIVILGYQDEPYLRFEKDGVFQNMRSPATYLNRFRYPHGLKPGVADPEARPRWRRVATGATLAWWDHRIHWTQARPPRGVRNDPLKIQRVFAWRVAGRADGTPFAVTGILGYSPRFAPSNTRNWLLLVALGAGATALALAVGLGARRWKRRAP